MGKKIKSETATIELERIKQLVVIAMFSDDKLMERFVLKGGNAIDLAYKIGMRASLDIDLSMEADFEPDEIEAVSRTIKERLFSTFQPEGFVAFDINIEEEPKNLSEDLSGFWGGYRISFKIISSDKHDLFKNDIDKLRRNAVMIGNKGKFEIDISKFEHCAPKQYRIMDGYRIFVYTPEMIIFEKLRAICQQMPEYGPIVHRTRTGTARARDFVDIYMLKTAFGLDLISIENWKLLNCIFDIKRVPLEFLTHISQYRDFHQQDFQRVKDTVRPGTQLEPFDFYFNFVVSLCIELIALRNI